MLPTGRVGLTDWSVLSAAVLSMRALTSFCSFSQPAMKRCCACSLLAAAICAMSAADSPTASPAAACKCSRAHICETLCVTHYLFASKHMRQSRQVRQVTHTQLSGRVMWVAYFCGVPFVSLLRQATHALSTLHEQHRRCQYHHAPLPCPHTPSLTKPPAVCLLRPCPAHKQGMFPPRPTCCASAASMSWCMLCRLMTACRMRCSVMFCVCSYFWSPITLGGRNLRGQR